MKMTLKQEVLAIQTREEAISGQRYKYVRLEEVLDAIDAHLARQSEGVSEEDVDTACAAYDSYGSGVAETPAMRAALTAVRHNRPAQEKATNYVSGHVDSVGKFHATAQEKAEPVATRCMPPDQEEITAASLALGAWMAAALEDPNVCAEMKRDINRWFDAAMPSAPPADRVRVPDGFVLVPEQVGDMDAFMVLDEYSQMGRTRKDAYRIAIRKLSERAQQMLSAAPEADHHD